jgi:hypothetical protein
MLGSDEPSWLEDLARLKQELSSWDEALLAFKALDVPSGVGEALPG